MTGARSALSLGNWVPGDGQGWKSCRSGAAAPPRTGTRGPSELSAPGSTAYFHPATPSSCFTENHFFFATTLSHLAFGNAVVFFLAFPRGQLPSLGIPRNHVWLPRRKSPTSPRVRLPASATGLLPAASSPAERLLSPSAGLLAVALGVRCSTWLAPSRRLFAATVWLRPPR